MTMINKIYRMIMSLLIRPMYGYDVTSIDATTLSKIEKKFQDNLSKRSPVIAKFRSSEAMVLMDGGKELSFPVICDNGNATSYLGDDTLPVTKQQLRRLTFSWRQFAATVRIDGLEEILNSGPEEAASILEGRMEGAEIDTTNKFETMLGADGTGNVGGDGEVRDWNGLQNLVSDTPTTGLIGGLSRTTFTQLRNQVFSTAVTAFNTSNAGRNALLELWTNCCQGGRRPNFIPTTPAIWRLYHLSLTATERLDLENGKDRSVTAGIPNLKFMDADVVLDGGMGGFAPASTAYFLNTKYIKYRPHSQRNMVPLSPGKRFSVNQDAEVNLIGWAGNLTCSNLSLQGTMNE